jgi:hypothetical protein
MQEMYEVDEAKYVDELPATLMELGGQGEAPTLFVLHGKNTDSGNWAAPAKFEVNQAFLNSSSVASLCLLVLPSDFRYLVLLGGTDHSTGSDGLVQSSPSKRLGHLKACA